MNGPDFTGGAHKNKNNYKRWTGYAIYNIHPMAIMFNIQATTMVETWKHGRV